MQLTVSCRQVASLCILLYVPTMHSVIYSVTSHMSSSMQTFSIKEKRKLRGPGLVRAHVHSLHCKHTRTLFSAYAGDRIILRPRASERDRFLAVKNMLSSAPHLSFNRIIKSSGGWRGEGGEGTMLRECGRMWETKRKSERMGRNRNKRVRRLSGGPAEKQRDRTEEVWNWLSRIMKAPWLHGAS